LAKPTSTDKEIGKVCSTSNSEGLRDSRNFFRKIRKFKRILEIHDWLLIIEFNVENKNRE
jgi:hypothetical protein